MDQSTDNSEYEYFEVMVPCGSHEVDEIESLLLSLGACSVTYRDADDVAILEPAPGAMPLWNDIEITAMYTKDYQEEAIIAGIKAQLPKHQAKSKKLITQVWERTWLEHFKPMQFGQDTWIIPSEFEAPEKQAINIYLDPGLAFGTGTHPTTALCLEWIDSNNLHHKKAIDFGCGSGILAIAAAKHGAQKVYCTDIDPQAIESTLSNCENNGVLSHISIVEVNQVAELKNLDIVMANILAAPLLTLVDTFDGMLKQGGELIMSGILSEQTDEIVAKFKQSFVDFQIKITDDWASVYAKKKNQLNTN
ncbi:MAG: 50S ribosomal protein L11 methyltransferase [Marinicellaceae bacterium]